MSKIWHNTYREEIPDALKLLSSLVGYHLVIIKMSLSYYSLNASNILLGYYPVMSFGYYSMHLVF